MNTEHINRIIRGGNWRLSKKPQLTSCTTLSQYQGDKYGRQYGHRASHAERASRITGPHIGLANVDGLAKDGQVNAPRKWLPKSRKLSPSD